MPSWQRMAQISLFDTSIRYGGEPLLDNVTLHIEHGDRVCLVGRNGEGKTTLMRILCGDESPDAGVRVLAPGVRVAYLPQDVPTGLIGTVRQVVEQGERHDHHTEAWEHVGRVDKAISQLSLEPDADFRTLSGGMKRRALLARALVCGPEVLLLDEPTNHLDIQSIEWLEQFLARYVETLVFVTHDRTFARKMAGRVLDLDRGQLSDWACDYDTYLHRKAQLLADEETEWSRKRKLLTKEEVWIRKGIKARRTRDEGRVRALQALRKTFAGRRTCQGKSRIRLVDSERSGDRVVKAQNVSFHYPGGETLVRGLDAKIERGERMAIIGPNGAGKTTLLRLLCGELAPTEGEIQLGTNLQVAYFDQLRASLDLARTVAWNVAQEREQLEVAGRRMHVLGYLQDFLFTPERARTPVHVLSGGEKNRLLLAKLFMEPSNLLVLDEPTNDLDSETLELLEEQVQRYAGTVLMVSHDRAFINNVATATMVFEDGGRVGLYPGGFDDWLLQRPRPKEAGTCETKDTRERPKNNRAPRLGFNEKRELAALPERIERLETKQAELEEALCHPELFKESPEKVQAMQADLSETIESLDDAIERWAELEAIAGE